MNKLTIKTTAKNLKDLVSGLVSSDVDVMIHGISDDTRHLQAGDAFLCLPRVTNLEEVLQQAVNHGAVAIIFVAQSGKTTLPSVCLPDMATAGLLLRRWFATEQATLPCIGITGTDGKTSTAWMLREALAQHLGSAWSCGTLGLIRNRDDMTDLANTTPSLLTLHTLFALALEAQVGALILEVSSHGIAQERIAGLPFSAAIWTTMGKDHLEDHGSFAAYLACKSDFVHDVAQAGGLVVANADYDLINNALADIKGVHFYAEGEAKVHFQGMPKADFHVENLAAVRGLMFSHFGVSFEQFSLLCAGHISTPWGRLEPVSQQVLIDYAHTAEGLKRCLLSARNLAVGRLLLVFGCGGDRDKAKRPLMGQVAAFYADESWLTSDNPRSEAQATIANDVLAGMTQADAKVHVCANRRLAIGQAVAALTTDDVLVVAGKGHESYMEIQGQRLPWSDQVEVLAALGQSGVQQCT